MSRRDYSIFISHSSKDKKHASDLCRGIELRGVKCFLANRDIRPGENFANEIVEAIIFSSIFVVIVSEASMRSPHVRREVVLAIEEGRDIVPLFLIKSLERLPKEWRYWLGGLQAARLESIEGSALLVLSALRDLVESSEAKVSARSLKESPKSKEGEQRFHVELATEIREQREGPVGLPSALLRAETGAVDFIGREKDLTRLYTWLELDNSLLVRLIVGPGGIGKTRLALELCSRAEKAGWHTSVVGLETDVGDLKGAGSGSCSLIVLDYAETRPSDICKLIELLRIASFAKVRLLLLARSDGDWWTELQLKSPRIESILTSSLPVKLGPLENSASSGTGIYNSALSAFSKLLRTPEPPKARSRKLADDVTPLEVQTIALLDVLDGFESVDPDLKEPPYSRLLNHERRYLKRAILAEGIEGVDTVDVDRVLAIMTLLGAESEPQALENIERGGFKLDSSTAKKLVRLLRRLYSRPGSYISVLRPEILAEELVAQVVEGSGHHSETMGFPANILLGANSLQLDRALTFLGRASRHDHVSLALVTMLAGLPDGIAEATIRVATRLPSPEPLVDALSRGLSSKKQSRKRLTSLLNDIPEESVALARVAADLCYELIGMGEFVNDESNTMEVARFLGDASNRFSDVGRVNDAIDAVRKGIEMQERFQQTESDKLELAAMLSNLSNRLWEAGNMASALNPAKEAVDLFKRIDGEIAFGLRCRKYYAAATSNLAFRLADLGKFKPGLRYAREAVARFSALSEVRERFVESGTASAINNLVCLLNATGNFRDAIVAAEQCMDRRSRQVRENRDHFLPFYARAMDNGAISYLGCGNHGRALELSQESFELFLILSENKPVFNRDLRTSGLNLAAIHASQGFSSVAVDTINLVLKRTFSGIQLTPPDIRIKNALDSLCNTLIEGKSIDRSMLHSIHGHSDESLGGIYFGLALEYKDL